MYCMQISVVYRSLMYSYGCVVYADQWDAQATIARTNQSLIARDYVTWFDLTNMKGSTMDAMSDAIEGADVMLYGVSLPYKESANVRNNDPFLLSLSVCLSVSLSVCLSV